MNMGPSVLREAFRRTADVAEKTSATLQLKKTLYRNPLDLIERYVVACTIIEFRCSRGLMRGDHLRVFYRPAVFQVGRDSIRRERVAAGRRGESGHKRAAS